MATIDTPPPDYPPEITGYAEPWIASPGETVAIKVSCTEPEYSYKTVRVIQGVDIEHSPKKELEEITSVPSGTAKGRFQLARIGSYARTDDWGASLSKAGLEVSLYFQPHLPEAGHRQAVISTLDVASSSGFAVVISTEGAVDLWVGVGKEVKVIETGFKPARKRWVSLKLHLNGTKVAISLQPIPYLAEKAAPAAHVQQELTETINLSPENVLLLAGSYAESPTSAFSRVTNFFNGRIDSPLIKSLGPKAETLVKYEFARNIAEDTIIDASGSGHDGVLVNAPTRGVPGFDWDASEADWTKAKYGYGAIHFHEDDLDDAAWETDFTFTLPPDARSGIYAVEVTSTNGKTSDMITFMVRPTKQTSAKVGAKVALVLSTFTYLAYANEKLADPNRSSSVEVGPGFDINKTVRTEDFYRIHRRLDCGHSNYDVHNDDSGVVFSSAKRPILNLRPGYVMWAFSRPRELSAESMMIGFLEREKIPYDVLTDHDLHLKGAAALAPYNTVMTGCHPEYPTIESYNAYEHYARRGGNLMYLGGNGFYWVSAVDPKRPWRLEVRRGDQGVRSYTLPGGERFMSLNGTQGGLWRTRGRSSHGLFGIAFNGEGTAPGVPYKRTEAGHDDSLKWMFDGIPEGELVGEYGLGGGASGDEIDSFDLACGSPTNAVVVASSTGHPDDFGIAPECTGFPIMHTLGTQTNEIRSDMVYYETQAGGAVFSVGSINWYCSLGWDDYQNNVAKLTGNVIQEFLRRGEVAGHT
ncbi:hypothetical protein LTR99_010880 [Exophiala xenobiotica]|uniref:N,N-dimethylformamidase beta subunit-like C-terminal domain-containing protein n=1 Tax=Vermiconidia calcicola TaxID=1690605 RepID=A0AAV9PU39_9PEZI|nr:hypothetical protein LTR96_010831 [Exophiala xenobiotica]KAK5528142.1 hypothetical protein LTR25_010657 [Vermiconidia calcicola]KAK5532544.1 hypothetical protein LTR23_009600 [Chaetothyriales sp. CCFEE 6169]KAK5291212.1 hypothetical protein LTR99_010880 [Exophiala xenobiotica]KAK5336518.1 hypothetical protein LTR98_007848 [Exophiala xenobiotica]